MIRTPVVLQMEAAECGAACLAMIMGAYGHSITLEESRAACATARDGVDAARLILAARSYGLEAHGYRREPEALAHMQLPMVLHWNFDHFVVLEKAGKRRFTILDPASGRRVVSRAEFGKSFTGVALSFTPGEHFVRMRSRRSTFRLLLEEANQSRDAVIASAVLGVVGILPALALSAAVSAFVDHIVGQSRVEWSAYLLLALAMVAAVQVLIAVVDARIAASLRTKISTHVAVRGFWRSLFLPTAFFAQRSAGEIVSRLRLGAEIGSVVAGPVMRTIPDVTVVLGYLCILMLISPMLAAAVAGVAFLNLFSMAMLSRRVAAANASLQVAEGAASGAMTAGFAALETYRLHGREMLLVERLAAAEDRALDREQRIGLLRTIGSAAPVASGLLISVVVLGVGSLLVMQGAITLGGLIACQMLAGLINGPVVAIAASVPRMQEAAGAFARIDDLNRHPIAGLFQGERRLEAPGQIQGRLQIKDMTFGFSPGQPFLQDITLEIAPGRIVAVMGPSGSGKSTLARIAAGIADPDSGEVSLDGLPLGNWPQGALRRALQYIPQQSAVFSGSIDDNLQLWDERVEQADIARALQLAGLVDVVGRRSGGTQAKINAHAPELSGGEVQRLAIARALARNPAILILDETTSALDMAAEAALLLRLRKTGATVIIVTHRISAAERCDEVVLMAEGRIIARGSPADLLRKDEVLASITKAA
jgi:ABC-type bacteriocin/lantibiotic exporter with double-glycine peptidase domain